MAEKKVHKKEEPNSKEPTPQKKKAVDMRSSGLSLNEISEKLNIPRKQVEELVSSSTDKLMKAAGKSAGKVLDKTGEKVTKGK